MPSDLVNRLSLAIKIILRGADTKPVAVENIPAISVEEIAEIKRFFPLDKFFIFGHARSGTTILARFIRLHPEVHCNWQAHFFTRPPLLTAMVADPQVRSWLKRRSNRWNQGRDLSPQVLRAVSDYIMEREARQLGKRIVGDKSPNSLLDGKAVHLLHNFYPDARLVYIVRDGRDTVVSHRFQSFIDSPQHLSREDIQIRQDYARNPDIFLKGERSIFTENGIRQAAEGWVHNVLQTHQAGSQLFGECYYQLRYEDLLANPWQETQKIWAFLGVSSIQSELETEIYNEQNQNLDAQWQAKKAGDLIKPGSKGAPGSWKDVFTVRDRQVFQEVAGETLRLWGYTND